MCSLVSTTSTELPDSYNVADSPKELPRSTHVYATALNNQSDRVGISGILAILFLLAMVSGLAVWVFYAYRNPHTTSGQMLIRVREFLGLFHLKFHVKVNFIYFSIVQVNGGGGEGKPDTRQPRFTCDKK